MSGQSIVYEMVQRKRDRVETRLERLRQELKIGAVPCPHCQDRAPKKDNGKTGILRRLTCSCGVDFEPMGINIDELEES